MMASGGRWVRIQRPAVFSGSGISRRAVLSRHSLTESTVRIGGTHQATARTTVRPNPPAPFPKAFAALTGKGELLRHLGRSLRTGLRFLLSSTSSAKGTASLPLPFREGGRGVRFTASNAIPARRAVSQG